MSDARLPPQSLEAERSVLGSMLRDNTIIGEVERSLRTDDFYTDAHRKIFDAILHLFRKGHPVDLVTLANRLEERHEIEDIGRYQYLPEVWDAAPTAANVEYYAKIVQDRSIRRQLITAGNEQIRDAYDGVASGEEFLEQAEKRIFAITRYQAGQGAYAAEVVAEERRRLEARIEGRSPAEIHSGFLDLDEKTGGFHDAELTVIGARPSVGKTALGVAIMQNVAVEDRYFVFFASLEQRRTELAERLLCSLSGVDSHKVRLGRMNMDEVRRWSDAEDLVAESPFFIDDTYCQTMLRIAGTARRLKAKNGLRLAIVDYLQLVEPESRKEPWHEQVAGTSRRLKQLARELNIPVIALAQLNRGAEEHEEPRLSDLRESGAIEQDADTVLLLNKPKDVCEAIDIVIAKQRNGPVGSLTLTFRKHCQRFENFAQV